MLILDGRVYRVSPEYAVLPFFDECVPFFPTPAEIAFLLAYKPRLPCIQTQLDKPDEPA